MDPFRHKNLTPKVPSLALIILQQPSNFLLNLKLLDNRLLMMHLSVMWLVDFILPSTQLLLLFRWPLVTSHLASSNFTMNCSLTSSYWKAKMLLTLLILTILPCSPPSRLFLLNTVGPNLLENGGMVPNLPLLHPRFAQQLHLLQHRTNHHAKSVGNCIIKHWIVFIGWIMPFRVVILLPSCLPWLPPPIQILQMTRGMLTVLQISTLLQIWSSSLHNSSDTIKDFELQ
jgi:hypothetical protein